jgi:hypothetical protein
MTAYMSFLMKISDATSTIIIMSKVKGIRRNENAIWSFADLAHGEVPLVLVKTWYC